MKMITIRTQIEFADPTIRAIDHIQDIRKAAESAGINLYSRHDVQLQYPMSDGDRVVVEIRVPEESVNTFCDKIGYHLRGVSNYLLNRCGDRYQSNIIGKRLLNYAVLPDSDMNIEENSTELSLVDRLEAVASFAKLLERNDKEAMDAISRILVILNEAKQLWE